MAAGKGYKGVGSKGKGQGLTKGRASQPSTMPVKTRKKAR